MAISFHRAPRVATGDKPSSTQLAGLATAFNDRLRSGLADPTWRLAFYLLALFRQVRNPDASGFLYPALAEFHEVYQMLDPDVASWPEMEPGEPEGANLASPMPAFIWGTEAFDLYDEASRLTDPNYGGLVTELPSGSKYTDAQLKWALGKQQRGAWDPDTGAVASPAFTAARAFSKIRYSRYSPHLNGYGGWQPTPELIVGVACDDVDITDEFPAPQNYDIFFTRTNEDASLSGLHHSSTEVNGTTGLTEIHYAGTCEPTDAGNAYAGHVAGIVTFPGLAYYVFTNPATIGDPYEVDYLPASDFVEGPYTGEPHLQKTSGDHFLRVMDQFARDFRGAWGSQIPMPISAAPPAGKPPVAWVSKSFDFRRFFREQYRLAPSRGVESGDQVLEQYQTVRVGKAYLPGHTSCRYCGCYASGGPGSVRVTDDSGNVCEEFSVSSDGIIWFSTPSVAGEGITIELVSGSECQLELAELYDYKPHIWDLYLTLRISGARWEE